MRTPQHDRLRNEAKIKQASHEREDEAGNHIVTDEVCGRTAYMEGAVPGSLNDDAQDAKYFRVSQHDWNAVVEMQWNEDGGKLELKPKERGRQPKADMDKGTKVIRASLARWSKLLLHQRKRKKQQKKRVHTKLEESKEQKEALHT